MLVMAEMTLRLALKQPIKASTIENGELIVHRFLVVIEEANESYSSYSPDLTGCVATGSTREEAEKNIYEAIEMHVQGLLEGNLPIPKSESFSEYVAIVE